MWFLSEKSFTQKVLLFLFTWGSASSRFHLEVHVQTHVPSAKGSFSLENTREAEVPQTVTLLPHPVVKTRSYTPGKLRWLAGKSPHFSIGNTPTQMVDFPASHVRFSGRRGGTFEVALKLHLHKHHGSIPATHQHHFFRSLKKPSTFLNKMAFKNHEKFTENMKIKISSS